MQFLIRSLGWGVVIYAVMYLLWTMLAMYGFAANAFSIGLRLLALTLLTAIAARSLRFFGWSDIAPYSLSWAATAIALDAIILLPSMGLSLFSSWSVWVGYGLIVCLPLITSKIIPRFSTA